MIVLLIPFLLLELYLSLKMGEMIGFWWSALWIMFSFMLGMVLLQKSPQTIMGNMQSVKAGKLDMRNFKNASLGYFVAAILLMIPGVLSDFLGLVTLLYVLYLQFVAKITPEHTPHFTKQGDEYVIDVEITNEHSRPNKHP